MRERPSPDVQFVTKSFLLFFGHMLHFWVLRYDRDDEPGADDKDQIDVPHLEHWRLVALFLKLFNPPAPLRL
jgi:hypothetical protein